MKLVLTESQLKKLKLFLSKKGLLEEKVRNGVELKTPQPLNATKEEKKEIEIKPKIENNKIKITSVSQLEKILKAVAEKNNGLKIPTKIKSKFEKEVKFSHAIVGDLKRKIVELIKTTSSVDDKKDGVKNVFFQPKKIGEGKIKPETFKSKLKKAFGIRSLELPLKDVDLSDDIVNDFLMDVSQKYTSDFILHRPSAGKTNLIYGK